MKNIFALIRIIIGLFFGLLIPLSSFAWLGSNGVVLNTTAAHYTAGSITFLFIILGGVLGYYANRLRMRNIAIIITICIAGAATFTLKSGGSKKIKQAEASCINWFKSKEMGYEGPFVSSSWKKSGVIVVEIGHNLRGKTYSTTYCLYDNGKLKKPNAFSSKKWDK